MRGCTQLLEYVEGIPYPVRREVENLGKLHNTDRLVLFHGPGHFNVPAEELDLILHPLEHAIAAELSRSPCTYLYLNAHQAMPWSNGN